MTNEGDVNVLVCCHYYGGGASLLEQEGMLEPALRSRGHFGKILTVETKKEVPDEPAAVTAVATAIMRELGWRPLVDNFSAALGSFKHSIFVYGIAFPDSSPRPGRE